jgi:hydrogenase-4 membrane subunit HyfE
MTVLLLLYQAGSLIPLLFQSWRTAVFGLGFQGLVLSLIMVASHGSGAGQVHSQWTAALVFEFVVLLLVRGFFAPWYLVRSVQGIKISSDFALIPPNFPQRAFAVALLAGGHLFGRRMCPGDPIEAMQVGVAAGGILLGMLVLAKENHPLGQVIGLFTLEGAVTLVELLSPHAMPFPVLVGVSVVSVFLILVCGRFMRRVMEVTSAPAVEPGTVKP